jgi:hypothetical protein
LSTFSARIQKVLDHFGVTAYKLGKDLKFSNVAIGNMLSDKTHPSYEFLTRLMDLYPTLNGNWLLMGRGDMFVDPSIRPRSHRVYSQDLVDAKNEVIALQGKNIALMEEKITQLTEELVACREAGLKSSGRQGKEVAGKKNRNEGNVGANVGAE